MTGDQPSAERPGGGGRQRKSPRAGSGYWVPLLVFGVLAALSLPLSVLLSPRLPTGFFILTRVSYPNLAQAMYLGGGSPNPPFPFPQGWYWVGVLAAGFLLTATWYRWRDRRMGNRTPLRRYQVTGLVLAALTAALPLAGLGVSTETPGPPSKVWPWLDTLWLHGTFALLVIAVGLGLLARAGHSRSLVVVIALFTAAVCFSGWLDLQQTTLLPQASFELALYPYWEGAVLLPAAVLLLAALATLTTTGLRQLRARRHQVRPT